MLEECRKLEQCEIILLQSIKEEQLLGEIPLTTDDRMLLEKLIKEKLAEQPEQATSFFREKAPASFACWLVWIGQNYYLEGDYWSAVAQRTGIEDSHWHNSWGKLIWDFLYKRKLPCLPKEGQYLVGSILLHGGIPESCIPQYFEQFIVPLAERELINFTAEALREKLEEIKKQEQNRLKIERELDEAKNRINLLATPLEKVQAQFAQRHRLQDLENIIGEISDLPLNQKDEDWYQGTYQEVKREEQDLLQQEAKLRHQIQRWNLSHNFLEHSVLLSFFMLANTLDNKELVNQPLDGKAEQLFEFAAKQRQLDQIRLKKQLLEEEQARTASAATAEVQDTTQVIGELQKTWRELEELGLLKKARSILKANLKKELDSERKYLEKELQDLRDKHKLLVAQQYKAGTTIITWLDEPVRRFILYSGKRGQKLIETCVKLMRIYLAGGEDLGLLYSLPESLTRSFTLWWAKYSKSRGIIPEIIKSDSSPTLVLDLDEEELLILIPEVFVDKKLEPEAQLTVQWEGGAKQFQITSFYREGEYLASEQFAFPLPEEARELVIGFQLGKHRKQWQLQLPQYMFFSDDDGSPICGRKLPAEPIWALIGPGWNVDLEPIEELYLRDDYRCLCLDLSETNYLILTSPEGELNLDVEQSLPKPKLRGDNPELLVGQLPVWTGQLPGLELFVPDLDQLEEWKLRLSSFGTTVLEENCDSFDFEYYGDASGYRIELILPQEGIDYGQLELGLWQRGRKLLRQKFYYLPDLELNFSQTFYTPDQGQIQFSLNRQYAFEPNPPLERTEDGYSTDCSNVGRTVTGKLKLDEEIELAIILPRVAWRLETWHYTPGEVCLEDWEGQDTIPLEVLFPVREGTAILYLDSQELKRPIKRGKATFDLAAIKDTASRKPTSTLELAFGTHRFPLLEIIGSWHIEGIRLEELPEGRLRLSWHDKAAPKERACRIWRFPRNKPLVEKEIPPQVRAVELAGNLKPGPYLLEFIKQDPWQPTSATFPLIGQELVFPIEFGPSWSISSSKGDLILRIDSDREIVAFCLSPEGLVQGKQRGEEYHFPKAAESNWLVLAKGGEVSAIYSMAGASTRLKFTPKRAEHLLALSKRVSLVLNQMDTTGAEATLSLAQYSIEEILNRIAEEKYGREFNVRIQGKSEKARLSWSEEEDSVLLEYSQGVLCLTCGKVVPDQRFWDRHHHPRCKEMIPSYKPKVYPTISWNYIQALHQVTLPEELREQMLCLYPDERLVGLTTWELKKDWSQFTEELLDLELENCALLLKYREAEQ